MKMELITIATFYHISQVDAKTIFLPLITFFLTQPYFWVNKKDSNVFRFNFLYLAIIINIKKRK